MSDLADQSGLPASVIKKIIGVFSSFPEIEQVLLYGSRAKGNYREGSDIDLCIRGHKIESSLLSHIEAKLDDLFLPYKIDLALQHDIQNQRLLDHIERMNTVFYRQNNTKEQPHPTSPQPNNAATTLSPDTNNKT